jgi:Putative metal-binding motif
MKLRLYTSVLAFGALSWVCACGARSNLDMDSADGGSGGAGNVTSTSRTSSPSATTTTHTVGSTTEVASSSTGPACMEGMQVACGSSVGACKPGLALCHAGELGPCMGEVGPTDETCNSIDDDCDGVVDNGFNIGGACKGTGTDQCLDGVITCGGCVKTGPDKVEVCNGVDDNCNGIIDADCQSGDCNPSLLVTGSTPSSPNCIDFPVMAGSSGSIEYPCDGGPVTATLGGISFTGSVTNNVVTLIGTQIIPPTQSPDGCTWENTHEIHGTLSSGTVAYSYSEMVIVHPPNKTCWSPCTESGTVQINWTTP